VTRIIRRTALLLTLAGGAAVAAASPALASGQAYPAPGFPSANASCTGSGYDFSAHYGANGESFPTVVHGAVGPSVSEDATTDGPGAVGEFTRSLAQTSGPIWVCVP
jgi:hypothetical protein